MKKITDVQLDVLIKSAVNSSGPLPPDEKFAQIISALRELRELRAAMLQGAEPVNKRDDLPFDYLQGQKDGLEWAAQLAEANHPQTGDWLYDDPVELAKAIRKGPDMPEPAGNSLAIPDGWVTCSERMPAIGVPVITCCGDVVQYAVYAWDGKEWQDWYEEYDKLPSDTFTHWHPRPAAPQQEVK